MSKTWFTSDLHLGHRNIIQHCSRPVADVNEMDRMLIDNWNAAVAPGDDVWVIGDFALGGPETVGHYLRRLNGHKHLVWGNHDKKSARTIRDWASSQAYAEVAVDGQRLVLLHYALRTWPGSNRGVLHLYGHSHGSLPVCDDRSLDVGVDVWGYRPVSLKEIRARLATQPARVSGMTEVESIRQVLARLLMRTGLPVPPVPAVPGAQDAAQPPVVEQAAVEPKRAAA